MSTREEMLEAVLARVVLRDVGIVGRVQVTREQLDRPLPTKFVVEESADGSIMLSFAKPNWVPAGNPT